MSDDLPFTTGPLKDWPLFEEAIERCFDHAERTAGREMDPLLRERVLEGVKGFFQIVTKYGEMTFSSTIPMPAGSTPEDRLKVESAVTGLVTEVSERYKTILVDLFGERILLELELATLRLRDRGDA